MPEAKEFQVFHTTNQSEFENKLWALNKQGWRIVGFSFSPIPATVFCALLERTVK